MDVNEKAKAYDATLKAARQWIKDGCTDKEKICLECCIAELRDSEDERIRKFLVKHVSEWIGCIEHDLRVSPKDVESEKELAMFKDGLAYLEKQKEQPTDAKSERVIKAARRVLSNWLAGDLSADVSGDLTELEYAIREYDGEEKQKEQKPQGVYVDCTEHPEWYGMPAKEQKPAEWSEEDEKIRRNLMSLLSCMRGDRITEETYQKYYPWLKSLRPQPKQEWSEEDEENLKAVIHNVEFSYTLVTDKMVKDFAAKLIAWLNSLRNRVTWKPSEEQMEALDAFIYCKYPDTNKYGELVKSLYQDLKKLM